MRKLLVILFFLPAFDSWAQQDTIPLEKIWASPELFPRAIYGINWMKDGSYYSTLEDSKIIKYDIKSGKKVGVLFDGKAAELSIEDYSLSSSEKNLLLQTNKMPIYRRITI